ncbi:MAG: c-type cytochrome [Erythrobacter sp.]|jgi:cytochrome c|nr:c-type cytochrome [Erythrobacter sp.]
MAVADDAPADGAGVAPQDGVIEDAEAGDEASAAAKAEAEDAAARLDAAAEEAALAAKADAARKEATMAAEAGPEIVKVAASSGPPASYTRCATCHTVDKGGADKLGPNLYGVYNSAAAQGSFAYSDALKNAGLTWDEATLHTWLENPRKMLPGNRMSFPGIKDAAKRQEIIDYLKQQG